MSKYNLRVRQNINYNEDLYFDDVFKNLNDDNKKTQKSKKQKSKEALVSDLRMYLIINDTLVGHDRLMNVLNAVDTAVQLTKYDGISVNLKTVIRNKIQEFLKSDISETASNILKGHLNELNK